MANDPTDLTKFPVPNPSAHVLERNTKDVDSIVNGGNQLITTRNGRQVPSLEKIAFDLGAVTFKGDYASATAYTVYDAVFDVGEVLSSPGAWYIATQGFTSTDIASDVAAGKLIVWQGADRREQLVNTPFSIVSDMQAADYLQVGDKIRWLGYYSEGDGGGNNGTVVAASTGTAEQGYIDLTASNLQVKLSDSRLNTPRYFGAVGDGATSDYTSFSNALNFKKTIHLDAGEFLIDNQLGEFTQIPINVKGESPDTVIVIGDFAAGTCFKVGAIGGNISGTPNYRERVKAGFENLVFKSASSFDYTTTSYNLTAIDLNIVFPVALTDNYYLDLGAAALKIQNSFYGGADGQVFVNSGIDLFEANTLSFNRFESRPANIDQDPTGGAYLFSNNSKYPIKLEDSDSIKFSGVIEGWFTPAIKLIRSDSIIFNDTWFEGLASTGSVIESNQSQDLIFNSCQIDCAIPYTTSFVKVDNSTPDSDIRTSMSTLITVNRGMLLLESVGFGRAPHFVTTTNSEDVEVLLDGVEFRGGQLHGNSGVRFNIRNMLLSSTAAYTYDSSQYWSDFPKFLYSRANATINGPYNSWISESESLDWDFASGADITEQTTSALTITTTTALGEYMTGSRGVKIEGMTTGSTWVVGRNTETSVNGPMTSITARDESYVFFARVKCDQDVNAQLLFDGGFSDVAPDAIAVAPLEAGQWVDIVWKPSMESCYAQAATYAPNVKISIENGSGSTATLYIDRLDYKKVVGDVMLSN